MNKCLIHIKLFYWLLTASGYIPHPGGILFKSTLSEPHAQLGTGKDTSDCLVGYLCNLESIQNYISSCLGDDKWFIFIDKLDACIPQIPSDVHLRDKKFVSVV